jgi:hypothetical protein
MFAFDYDIFVKFNINLTMKNSKYFYLTICIMLLAIEALYPQARHSRRERKVHYSSSSNYEVEITGVGQDGTKTMKVWGYGKKVEDAIIQAKMNAVASVIFRGIPGGQGAASTPAILSDPNAADEHADYFDEFFSPDGKYLRFINLTTDGMPGGQDRLRMSKPKGFKVAIYAQVMYDNLRRQLEADGIARRLDSGF